LMVMVKLELESELGEWGLIEVILFEVMVRSEGLEVPGRVTLVRLSVVMVGRYPIVRQSDCVWGCLTRIRD
jgi:hypothetical protein